jgi:hypothetical protein
MNGAIVEPSVNTTKPANKPNTMTTGNSQYRLRDFM